MSDSDRIEEQRELVDGLEYEDWRERMSAADTELEAEEASALIDRLERFEANLPKAAA